MNLTDEQVNKIFELASMQNKLTKASITSSDISEALIEIERKIHFGILLIDAIFPLIQKKDERKKYFTNFYSIVNDVNNPATTIGLNNSQIWPLIFSFAQFLISTLLILSLLLWLDYIA